MPGDTLIAGTCHLESEEVIELAKLWLRSARYLNPETDMILIDSGGATDSRIVLHDIDVFRFDENIGAISRGQRDGSGRGFCKAIEIAIERKYRYLCIWEADLLFARPVSWAVDRMRRAGAKVAASIAVPYPFPEWGICFFDVEYLRDTNFITNYGWETAPPYPIPEWRLEAMFGPDLWMLPMRGIRNEANQVTPENIMNMFPYYPPDWITHCADFRVYRRFLEVNRIMLP